MPDFGLKPDEIEGVLALFASVAKRPYPEVAAAAPPVDPAKAGAGQLIYVLKCAECHNVGKLIPLVEVKQQGPDLIHVADRVRHDWFPAWIKDPQAIQPGSKMVTTNLSDEEIDQIRAFLWKVSGEAATAGAN